MAERRRRPTREELDERLRFVLGKIPVSVIDGERLEPGVTPIAATLPKPEPLNGTTGDGNGSHGNGTRSANGHGRIVSGTITGAGEG